MNSSICLAKHISNFFLIWMPWPHLRIRLLFLFCCVIHPLRYDRTRIKILCWEKGTQCKSSVGEGNNINKYKIFYCIIYINFIIDNHVWFWDFIIENIFVLWFIIDYSRFIFISFFFKENVFHIIFWAYFHI